MRPNRRCISVVGDRNPTMHGGGYIYKEPGQTPYMEYVCWETDTLTEQEGDDKGLLYRVDIWDNAFIDCEWAKPEHVANYTGISSTDIQVQAKGTILERAYVYIAIADYYGWMNLDSYPLRLTRKEYANRVAHVGKRRKRKNTNQNMNKGKVECQAIVETTHLTGHSIGTGPLYRRRSKCYDLMNALAVKIKAV